MRYFLAALLLAASAIAQPQPAPSAPSAVTYLRCGAIFDGKSDQLRRNVTIVVAGDRIREVSSSTPPAGANVVDLPGSTCLPGLIDVHTHVLLQGDITAEDYDVQLLKQSVAYRAIQATVSARRALDYGFTTIRDLETEGAGYADVDLRNAINRGIVPGPRMKVATRALDVTGSYPLQGYNWEIDVPHGVQFCDGPDDCRKAVREQISHGADWIKVYVDRSYYFQPAGSANAGAVNGQILNDVPTFTLDELRAIVDEAHRQRRPVAAHAMALQGVHNAVEAGVDSIEHGDYIAPDDLQTMVRKGIWYVPTIYVGEYVAEGRARAGAPVWLDMVKINAETVRRAVAAGVKIAYGTDVGGFDWGINMAIQFPSMIKDGLTPAQALRSATSAAAELLRMSDQVGTLEPGKLADIVAVPGDPLADVAVLQRVNFVMKGGAVYKNSSRP
jgi:imidazolonepropionase-like amidohydrolase